MALIHTHTYIYASLFLIYLPRGGLVACHGLDPHCALCRFEFALSCPGALWQGVSSRLPCRDFDTVGRTSAREGGGGGVMLGRSRKTADPCLPTMPGRSTSGFHRRGRHRVHRARSAVRCSASRVKGELHPAKNHLRRGLPHLVSTSLHIYTWTTASKYICFLVWPFPETANVGMLCNCLVGALPHMHTT